MIPSNQQSHWGALRKVLTIEYPHARNFTENIRNYAVYFSTNFPGLLLIWLLKFMKRFSFSELKMIASNLQPNRKL
jgi:hypothetical protein